MSVAVVIPLFNGAPWIEDALRSVFAQERAPSEVLVVDDGSTDDGMERVRRFDGVELVRSPGPLLARSTGVRASRAPLVAFLDQDDLWHPAHLRVLEDALRAEPEAPGAAAVIAAFRDGEAPELAATPETCTALDPWAVFPISCPIVTPSATMFRRAPQEAIGGWSQQHTPDWQTYLGLSHERALVQVAAPSCGYRMHARARSAALQRDGLGYLDLMRTGAASALAFRRERLSDDPMAEALERRAPILGALHDLMTAVALRDDGGAARAASVVEAAVAPESDAYVDGVFALLTYLYCPFHDSKQHRRQRAHLLYRLEEIWPPSAARTTAALARQPHRKRFTWGRFLRAARRRHFVEARGLWRHRNDG